MHCTISRSNSPISFAINQDKVKRAVRNIYIDLLSSDHDKRYRFLSETTERRIYIKSFLLLYTFYIMNKELDSSLFFNPIGANGGGLNRNGLYYASYSHSFRKTLFPVSLFPDVYNT